MDLSSEPIEPGWAVCASDGEDVGTVVSIEGHNLIIKKKGLLGEKKFSVPRSAVTDIETGRIELSMTRKQVEQSQVR